MILLTWLACATETPPPPPPVALPAGPSAETSAAAGALRAEVEAVTVAFQTALSGRAALHPTQKPCTSRFDAARAAVWVTEASPAVAPGVEAAQDLLAAVGGQAGGSSEGDFTRVRGELASTTVFYWEAAGAPPVVDTQAKPAESARVFVGGQTRGEAWVWDGGARRLVCHAEIAVENTAPIPTPAGEKLAWPIGLMVSAAAAASAVALSGP